MVTEDKVAPTIQITGTQTLTCTQPAATISTTVSPACTYTWSGAGIVSGQSTSSIVCSAPDIYTVVVTGIVNGCVNSATSTIIPSNNLPVATITVTSTNNLVTCTNTNVTLHVDVLPVASYSYAWSNSASTSNVNVSTGNYTVVVTNTLTGCSTFTTHQVLDNIVKPNIATSNAFIACGNTTANVVATSTNLVSYNWTTTNGVLNTNGNAIAQVASTGIYSVTATDLNNGCTSTATATVTQDAVHALFTANQISGAAPLAVDFTNQSTGIGSLNYVWNFADNSATSTSTNASHTFTIAGVYNVVLTTFAGTTCSDSYTLTIEVLENSTVIIPNVFTPNGDGANDLFKITTTGIKDLKCDIFNRWGTKVHTLSSVTDTWDGGNHTDGTYFFILKCTGYDGKTFDEKGTINLYK